MDQDTDEKGSAPATAGRYAMVRALLDQLDGATLERLLEAVERQPARHGEAAAPGAGMVRHLLGQPRAGA